jgi:hypothetical protein
MPHFSLPYVSIKPNYFTTYMRWDATGDTQASLFDKKEMPVDNKTDGLMSYKANKRVRLAIDWLINISKDKSLSKKGVKTNFNYKLNFVTLTLSSKQKHSDNEIKAKMLNQFLTELRTKHKCENYIWRAEAQANGNIHFHIVTDVFISWRVLRTDWNRIQEKLGYISRFTEKTGKVDPNSTDVHAIKKVKNLSNYLAKYCSKNSKGYVVLATKATKEPFKPKYWLTYKHPKLQPKAKFYRQIHGKLWGLSQTLSKLKSAAKEVSGRVEAEVIWLSKYFPDKVKYIDRAAVYMFDQADLLKKKCLGLVTAFNNYRKSILEPSAVPEPIPIIEQVTEVVKRAYVQTNLEGIWI